VPAAFVTGGSGFVGGAVIERLRREGWDVRALARSERAAERVRKLGAEPVMGDLDDLRIEECEFAFHAAAKVEDFGDLADFERVNVQGTRNVVHACKAGGVRRLVHVGTEAALMAGKPLVNVDERAELRPDSPVLYSASKAKAEIEVRAANGDGLETVVVRPRFVWGNGDTSLLPQIVEMVRSGRFSWVGGGRQLTATTHIDNTVEGLWLAATRGPAGGVWFVTDGEPIQFREFLTALVATQGAEIPNRSVPAPVAKAAASVSESLWRRLRRPGSPPLTRFAVWVSSQECTIDISRAERELGYRPVRTREEGLTEMRSRPPG
jgi:nucleoside-diphosphate-sugar epimerase